MGVIQKWEEKIFNMTIYLWAMVGLFSLGLFTTLCKLGGWNPKPLGSLGNGMALLESVFIIGWTLKLLGVF